MSQRRPVICVVDVVVVVDGKNVVMIKRNIEPYQDKLCLPGGHVDFTDESLAHAAARELYEEVNITVLPDQLRRLCELDAPNRDPRPDARRISIVFKAELSGHDIENMRPASDAKSVALVDLFTLQKEEVGFDHFIAIESARRLQRMANILHKRSNGLLNICHAVLPRIGQLDQPRPLTMRMERPDDQTVMFRPIRGEDEGYREALSRLRQRQTDLRQMAASGFLFHVCEDNESVMAAIVAKKYWAEHHRLDDSNDNDRFLESYDLFPTEKGTYAPTDEMTVDQLRAKLLSDGFAEDPEFSAFIESHT